MNTHPWWTLELYPCIGNKEKKYIPLSDTSVKTVGFSGKNPNYSSPKKDTSDCNGTNIEGFGFFFQKAPQLLYWEETSCVN